MRVALVHDDFVQAGGAESLFATIASIWPQAPIYTSLVDWHELPPSINPNRIVSSWIGKIPFAKKLYKIMLFLYPLAFESFNFDDFDLVISSTTRFAKSIITKPKTVHVCYLNSLPRFLWNRQILLDYLPRPLTILLAPILSWLRRWDKVASARVDYYIANSQNVAQTLREIYKRDSDVVYPFADINFFKPAKIHNWKLKSQNYFLVVSRLVKWKKIDLAIKSVQALKINLIIVGKGPDQRRLKSISKRIGADVQFVGKVTRQELRSFYQNCQALIVTAQEDFGIAVVEAQATGRPVIAYQAGGQGEIIKNGKTGLFFNTGSPKALQDAIKTLLSLKWSVSVARTNAVRFKKKIFVREFKNKVKEYASKPSGS